MLALCLHYSVTTTGDALKWSSRAQTKYKAHDPSDPSLPRKSRRARSSMKVVKQRRKLTQQHLVNVALLRQDIDIDSIRLSPAFFLQDAEEINIVGYFEGRRSSWL